VDPGKYASYDPRTRNDNRLFRRLRHSFIVRHPLCACGEPASVLDHIVPHRGDVALFWSQANWQAMCKKCHGEKTGRGL
jgi:5-methylcytosine-specific restriction endonuclease McrA